MSRGTGALLVGIVGLVVAVASTVADLIGLGTHPALDLGRLREFCSGLPFSSRG